MPVETMHLDDSSSVHAAETTTREMTNGNGSAHDGSDVQSQRAVRFKPLNMEMRHGFEEEYSSPEYMDILANSFFIYFDDKRHNTSGNPMTEEEKALNYKNYQPILDWKIMKDRQKTVSAAIVLCLNLGVDPPDIVKTHPCAVIEGGVNPANFTDTKKCLQAIGDAIQKNLENLSMRTKYKQSLDPSVEDMKRFLNQLRRSSKDERILFHYNGHGVPQPTASGEIWVFNRGYTQYIPISLYDLQTWLGAPCIYVYDCNSAGNIISNFKKFVQKRIDDDNSGNHDVSAPSPTSAYIDSIQLAACRSNELLPMNPELPADLFTCCLSSPIEISVKWFVMNSPLKKHGYYDSLYNENGAIIIPGKLTDRRTPLGELNWIFTAITDTIAWTSLSRPLFKRLFRQDLMVAALFRNFLLAKRIMPLVGCNPISDPPLPDVRNHALWESFDLAIDQILSQLLMNQKNTGNPATSLQQLQAQQAQAALQQAQQVSEMNGGQIRGVGADPFMANFQHSTFFEQHLTAFEMWLKYGSQTRQPPEQLPIVLQVLLSQVHRIRALSLLSRFLDLGPWAVYLALSIGIFPYVLKLLQSPAQELKPVLTFIWARILGVDYKNTQQELAKDKGYDYFLQILNIPVAPGNNAGISNQVLGEPHRAMCCFIISLFVKNKPLNKKLVISSTNNAIILNIMETTSSPHLRQWSALLLSQLWDQYPEGKWISYKDGILDRLVNLLNDPIPEVRTSIVVALSNFLPDVNNEEEETNTNNFGREELQQQEIRLAIAVLNLMGDGSPIVRREIVVFFSKFVLKYLSFFLVSAFGQLEEEIVLIDDPMSIDEVRRTSPSYGTIFSTAWKALLIFSEDPHNEVQCYAQKVVDYVLIKLNESKLGEIVTEMEQYLLQKSFFNLRNEEENRHKINELNVKRRAQASVGNSANLNRAASLNLRTMQNGNSTSIVPESDERRIASSASTMSTTSFTERLRSSFSISTLLKSLNIIDSESDGSSNGEALSLNGLLNVSYKPITLGYGVERKPLTPRFVNSSSRKRPKLPLATGFFDYSCEYFQEPQIGIQESEESGSEEYAKKIWRRNRNEAIISETQAQKNLSLTGNWVNISSSLDNKTQPKLLKFTQFESYLVCTDDKDTVTCFDYEKNTQLSRFSNGNSYGTKITDIKFLNEDDSPLLLTGSSDGIVKLYRNFNSTEDVQLISSWRALTDLLLTSRSTGLISEWQQSRGSLLVTGDVKIIRLWDAPREMCIVDIPARSTSSISSITSDQVAGSIFTCGFNDGTIRVYDRRLSSRESMVKLWKTNNSSIKKLQLQRGGLRELVSGNSDGTVSLWDIRNDGPLSTFKNMRSLMTMEVHEHAPVFAVGSKNVDIVTTSGDLVTTVKNPYGYLTNRPSNYLSTLALHPHRMMMATNYSHNSHITVYDCSEPRVDEF